MHQSPELTTASIALPSAPLLEGRSIARRFGHVWALAGVDLRLARGEALLLMGRNGSGKTTLLRILSGALRPDRGELRVDGESSRHEIRQKTAFLGHAPFTYEPLTAFENLELFARLSRRPADRRSLLARLDAVGLADRAGAPLHTLSTGMHKRLALARLLLQRPAIALLDEPHSALDPEGAMRVDAAVRELKREGAAVVLATHQVERCVPLCERGIILESGRIQWEGPTQDLPIRYLAIGDNRSPGGHRFDRRKSGTRPSPRPSPIRASREGEGVEPSSAGVLCREIEASPWRFDSPCRHPVHGSWTPSPRARTRPMGEGWGEGLPSPSGSINTLGISPREQPDCSRDGASPLAQLGAAFQKDLRLCWRTRAHAVAVFAFGATALLLLSFAAGPDARSLRQHAGGFLWIALLFGAVVALAESFRHEHEQRALEGLLLLSTSPHALFYAKALANTAQLALLGIALVPVMTVLCDATPGRLVSLGAVIVLGAAGLGAPGTLYAAMTSQIRGAQLLLPLLLLPLAVPVLLAATQATSLILLGDPMGQLGAWTALLAAFDVAFWPLCGLLFGAVVEE